jgi:hypothetical protein
MMTKTEVEEITALKASERLNIDRTNVLRMIKRGDLNGRLNTEAPQSYWLISVDDKFLAQEKARSQSLN